MSFWSLWPLLLGEKQAAPGVGGRDQRPIAFGNTALPHPPASSLSAKLWALVFFLVQLHLPKCRWTGNIVDRNFLKFSSEINMLQSYLKGPDFQSWATPAEVRGLKVSPTESLRSEPLSEVCGFNPPPFTVRPLLWELGILDSLWSQLFAIVSSCSFAHMTALVLPVSLPFWTVGNISWNYRHVNPN